MHPTIAPVRIRGTHAVQAVERTGTFAVRTSVITEADAGLTVLAEALTPASHRHAQQCAELVLESCHQIFRGRKANILDELAEVWWLGEHGEETAPGVRRARRPYSTLPIADRVELRDRIAALLERRTAESMGDIAALEAETSSLLAVPERALRRAASDIYRYAEGNRDWQHAAASAGCAIFAAGRISTAHLGGVRIVRIREGELETIVSEHTIRNAVRAEHPEASEQQLADVPETAFTKMLGMSDELGPEVTTSDAVTGDVFVMTNNAANLRFPRMELLTAVRARGLGAAEYLVKRSVEGRPVAFTVVEVL